jgi:hypothetical protein
MLNFIIVKFYIYIVMFYLYNILYFEVFLGATHIN